MNTPFAIEMTDLCKTFDGVDALCGLSLQVPAGSVCGLLGKNGAGKTTALKVLLGLTRPTSGRARVFGLDPFATNDGVRLRQRLGFVNDDKDLYDFMSVREMVRFTADFFPRWQHDRAQEYLRRFDLPIGRSVKALSRGMRTKLALLLALSRGADLLVLDEPTAGLDPAVSEEVLQAIVGYVASAEATVFFTSHQITEVEQIADHVAIINRGRTAVAGPLDDLRASHYRVEAVFDAEAPSVTLRAPGVDRVTRRGRTMSVLGHLGPDAVVAELTALGTTAINVHPLSLKDLFLNAAAPEV